MDMDDDFVGTLEFDLSARDAELVHRRSACRRRIQDGRIYVRVTKEQAQGLSLTASQISPHV
jgi:hypothetical protein